MDETISGARNRAKFAYETKNADFGIGLANEKEFLEEVLAAPNPDSIAKLIVGSITDVQTYRIRKMVELLSILILFDRNAGRDEEYRIFLNAENLDLLLFQQQDFKDLYERRVISNTQLSIDEFARRINQDLPVPRFYFVSLSASWTPTRTPQNGPCSYPSKTPACRQAGRLARHMEYAPKCL